MGEWMVNLQKYQLIWVDEYEDSVVVSKLHRWIGTSCVILLVKQCFRMQMSGWHFQNLKSCILEWRKIGTATSHWLWNILDCTSLGSWKHLGRNNVWLLLFVTGWILVIKQLKYYKPNRCLEIQQWRIQHDTTSMADVLVQWCPCSPQWLFAKCQSLN